ncbi:BMP family protein [Microlunatus sp. Gsoil 973]|uniref:BMP family lipoprotein n=1 Tax=Microlunatus sp. Gsoil 973 TaxID=2672569 RepID=UPI00351AF093
MTKLSGSRSLVVAAAASASIVLALAGCAKPPSESGGAAPQTGATTSAAPSGAASSSAPTAGSSDFKACMVSDSGGFDDKSFNQTSYKGMTDAKKELGIQTNQIESNSNSDYAKNIQSMVAAKCNIIVTVGFLLSDDTLAAAKANPDIDFAIVDNYDPKYASVKNLKGLEFNTAQSAFLGGYLAAAMTKTGKVGTFGGQKIPTVTVYMDGYSQGVQYYNQQNHKNVKVLGWNATKQDGDFTNDFENPKGGLTKANNLISQGADILFPVAGPAGEGALQAAKASGGKVNAIWVDTDGCVSAANYCPQIISSVYKGMDVAVKDVITNSKNGSFDPTPYIGTLENGGTGLTPFHQWDSKVPADVKSKLDQLKADIISGKIKITSKAQPSS